MAINRFLLLLVAAVNLFAFSCKQPEKYRGCGDDSALNYDPAAKDIKELCIYPYELKQFTLNNSTFLEPDIRQGCTENTKDKLPSCFTRKDKNGNSDSTFRRIYMNYRPIAAPIRPGVFLAQHVFNPFGKLLGVYGMYRQPSGYFPEGGDFEYVIIDPKTVTDSLTNGVLPTPGPKRGKLAECAICHSRGANTFLFNEYK